MESKEIIEILSGVFGNPYRKVEDVRGIPVVIRTLYDAELADALKRSLAHSSVEFQLFAIKRWKLAYALVAVNDVQFPAEVEAAYKIIAGDPEKASEGWPAYFVELMYSIFEDACAEEADLVDTLKKSTGTDD